MDSEAYPQFAVVKVIADRVALATQGQAAPPMTAPAGQHTADQVEFVIRGSAAYDADLIKGDIILTIAGEDFSNLEKTARVKIEYAGQTVPLELVRNGKRMTLQITVPKAPMVTLNEKTK